MNRALSKRLLCCVVLWVTTQAYAQSATPTFSDPGKAPMSRDEQHALGLQAGAQVYQQMPVLPDHSVTSVDVRRALVQITGNME